MFLITEDQVHELTQKNVYHRCRYLKIQSDAERSHQTPAIFDPSIVVK